MTSKPHTAPAAPGRRSFLDRVWLLLGALALCELGWLLVSFVRPRKGRVQSGDFGTAIEAGAVDSFEPNSVTAFPRGHFYLARLPDGGFLALSRRCTHLGCTVPWVAEEMIFACPCHASTFDIRGDVIRSPAPRALDIYPVTIENNIVRVDTGRALRRTAYQASQAAYPDRT